MDRMPFSLLGGARMDGMAFLVVVAAIYVAACYCVKVICEKCGHEPGVLIWIPIVNLIPLLQVAGLPTWTILLMLPG